MTSSRSDASSLAEQLQRGFHGLRFEGELESAYRRDQFHDRLRYLRINLAILAAISLAVIQIDHVVVPVIGRIVPDLARTGVMLPLLLMAFAITFIPRADAWYPRYIAVAMTAALVGMSWISLDGLGAGRAARLRAPAARNRGRVLRAGADVPLGHCGELRSPSSATRSSRCRSRCPPSS